MRLQQITSPSFNLRIESLVIESLFRVLATVQTVTCFNLRIESLVIESTSTAQVSLL